ncbi:MAG: asparagine synthase B [Gemmatimonadales bacterium]|nr:asparagine synthase B [Gemmatimonadales bacterium]
MCGIAGIWGKRDEDLVRRMMGRLAHRGPDAEGVYLDAAGTLGHRRLSIMDPQRGGQPIYDEARERAVITNGEIYNYLRLRSQLSSRHSFRTRSDSEVPLHLYEELGQAVVRRLDGMFAFAIADGESLFLARDPIGIKPLYYGQRDGVVVFASELKALVGVAEEVHEFPPGNCFHSDTGFRPYYQVPDRVPRDMPLKMRLQLLRETLDEAVQKRLMSDVPVGAFLSGGLDSSLIVALLRPYIHDLHTFSVGTEGSPDLEAARTVARYFGTQHHEYVFGPEDVAEVLGEIIYHLESFDQDLVRSAIPCYFVSRLAAEHVKVVLTGEGADELFAGYEYYRGIRDWASLHQELRRSVSTLHNINLQRVDRLTMAHSIEGRIPFLDLEMVQVAQTIPADLKLYTDESGELWDKWILRKAFEDLLPTEIVWRDKQQFDEGSGTVQLLGGILDRWLEPEEAEQYRTAVPPDAGLRSREECVYHKLLGEAYGESKAIFANVARWSARD